MTAEPPLLTEAQLRQRERALAGGCSMVAAAAMLIFLVELDRGLPPGLSGAAALAALIAGMALMLPLALRPAAIRVLVPEEAQKLLALQTIHEFDANRFYARIEPFLRRVGLIADAPPDLIVQKVRDEGGSLIVVGEALKMIGLCRQLHAAGFFLSGPEPTKD